MTPALLQNVRAQIGRAAYGSALYHWSLKTHAPEELLFKPHDSWIGCMTKGRALTQGIFEFHGQKLSAHGNFWKPNTYTPLWLDYLHKFEWLRDLRSLGGDDARFAARAYINEWLKNFYNWDEEVWTAPRLGRRIAMWLALYDFYGESADDQFQRETLTSVTCQARHLYRLMPASETGIPAMEAALGLIYAGLSLPEGERWLDYGLSAIAYEAEEQILHDGGHISRNPATLLKAVAILLDVRTALISAKYPLPPQVQHAIDRALPAVRFFRYPDKRFAVFNGAQEEDVQVIERVMMQSETKRRTPKSLPNTGYKRLSAGRSILMIDTGKPAAAPYDREAHVAPGAFELIIARERVFVSCGTHPLDHKWRDMLRGTAAHNALTLDDRNAYEIRKNGHVGRKPKKITSTRGELNGGELLTLKHDAYVPVNGVVHRRRFFMDKLGHDIRGEDELSAKTGSLTRPVKVCVRFHLHPRVLVSLIRDGEEALLLLPSGSGWRFHHEGTKLSLENSIYLGEGTYPRKTKQLVLTTIMDQPELILQWALQRESV